MRIAHLPPPSLLRRPRFLVVTTRGCFSTSLRSEIAGTATSHQKPAGFGRSRGIGVDDDHLSRFRRARLSGTPLQVRDRLDLFTRFRSESAGVGDEEVDLRQRSPCRASRRRLLNGAPPAVASLQPVDAGVSAIVVDDDYELLPQHHGGGDLRDSSMRYEPSPRTTATSRSGQRHLDADPGRRSRSPLWNSRIRHGNQAALRLAIACATGLAVCRRRRPRRPDSSPGAVASASEHFSVGGRRRVGRRRSGRAVASHSAFAFVAASLQARGAFQASSLESSAASAVRPSPTTGNARCLTASNGCTLTAMNRRSGFLNNAQEPVMKSANRVPTPTITSACAARAFAPPVLVTPTAPMSQRMIDRRRRFSRLRLANRNSTPAAEVDQLPFCVKEQRDAAACEITKGFFACFKSAAASSISRRVGRDAAHVMHALVEEARRIIHRPRSAHPGRRRASPVHTRPDRAGTVIARLSASTICSGTCGCGRNSATPGESSRWRSPILHIAEALIQPRTGSGLRLAKTSPDASQRRQPTCDRCAVTMLVALGPIELVQAIIRCAARPWRRRLR